MTHIVRARKNIYLYEEWRGDGDFSDLIVFMIDIKEQIRRRVPNEYLQSVQFRTNEDGFTLWYSRPETDEEMEARRENMNAFAEDLWSRHS